MSSARMAPLVSKSSLHRTIVVGRIERRRVEQHRNLWWWSRHSSWSSSTDENLEEFMQRRQKIMRYRYSRALRRRAMWDRDDSPPSWSWRVPGRAGWLNGRWTDSKSMSSTENLQAKLDEKESGIPHQDRPWQESHRDFESFKASVDKAIAKDPYGFLFGRRLQGPISSNNSSWTSLSWIFDPKQIRDESSSTESRSVGVKRKIEIENLDEKRPSKFDISDVPFKGKDISTEELKVAPKSDDHYIYDPISGRKILKASTEPKSEIPAAPKRPFLETLFGEHNSTPVKPVKPHKVYGFVPKEDKPVGSSAPKKEDSKAVRKGLENSRLREYQQLRAMTLGNSIDTTAEFYGKYDPEPAKKKEIPTEDTFPKKKTRETPEPDDTTPLFSGTTYESKKEPQTRTPQGFDSTWLAREGFQEYSSPPEATDQGLSIAQKLEQSWDLWRSTIGVKSSTKSTSQLQPALDRMQGLRQKDVRSQQPSIPEEIEKSITESDIPQEKREDVDLLRASDVRAAARAARKTKQDIQRVQVNVRAQLEKDFDKHQKEHDEDNVTETKGKLSKGLDHIVKHMQLYPQGIVAKTMQSMGPLKAGSVVNEKPVVNLGELDKTQIEKGASSRRSSPTHESDKKTVLRAHKPSAEVARMEKSRQALTDAVKAAHQQSAEQDRKTQAQITTLAKEMRDIVESEQADTQTTNKSSSSDANKATIASVQTISVDSHPLKSASVKPGVPRYPAIERYMTVFEPKLIQLREGSKSAEIILKDVESTISDISKRRQAESVTLSKGTAQDASIQSQPEVQGSRPASVTPNPKPSYLLLVYNKTTGEVDTTEMDRLPWSPEAKSEKANPIKVMGNLNYPAAFVTHFVELEKAGYELSSGGGDMLVFQKRVSMPKTTTCEAQSSDTATQAVESASRNLKNVIAAQESAAQPAFTPSKAPKQAATVLDNIPTEIPAPGPSAPIAPPVTTNKRTPSTLRPGPKVRRQEQVFSGTIRPPPSVNNSDQKSNHDQTRPGFFSRLGRTIRRVILTTAALGSVAYVIGVVAEFNDAEAQQAMGRLASSEAGADTGLEVGPRKKIVLPMQGQEYKRTRPGIFSTESSRD